MLKLISGRIEALGTFTASEDGITKYSDARLMDHDGKNHFLPNVVIHPESHSYLGAGTEGKFLFLETNSGRGNILLAAKVDGELINEFDRVVGSIQSIKSIYRVPLGVALFFAVLALVAEGLYSFALGGIATIALVVGGLGWLFVMFSRIKFPSRTEFESALEQLKSA